MRALTLTQPWAGLVASGIKLIENRPQRMIKASDFGTPFAIHASREIDVRVYQRITTLAPALAEMSDLEHEWFRLSRITSAVIAVATIDRDLHGWSETSIREHELALREKLGDQFRWFFGPVGYVLRDVVALPAPIACKGALGFWTLPPQVERDVRAQFAGQAA
jgi:hypothetical protein